MIRTIWIRIAVLLALAVLPATLLQLKLQGDSIAFVFDVADRTGMRLTLDSYLAQLRESAKLLPAKEAEFRAHFQEASLTKRAVEEFFLARSSIDREIRNQMLTITLATLLMSLLSSLLISRGIVKRFRSLIKERERAASKLRDLSSLQNWQMIARTLVHELKAPMTPIKLITSDIDRKYQTLDPQSFERYLGEAKTLLAEQIAAIESMIDGFTMFGRLPQPNPRATDLNLFLRDFVTTYSSSFGLNVTIHNEIEAHAEAVPFDQQLIRDLLFNLMKNASEANNGATKITLRSHIEGNAAVVWVHNTGSQIPDELKLTIFDPYVSTKKDFEHSNMGLGLTVARKIALDHGGDLLLDEQAFEGGVTFRIELPLCADVSTKGNLEDLK